MTDTGTCKSADKHDSPRVIDTVLASGLRGRGGAGFPPEESGNLLQMRITHRSMYAVTPTRVTPEHSWTVHCLKEILTA